MALSSGLPFPEVVSFSINTFWNDTSNPGSTAPFCSIPPLSLDASRIASLTNILPADCGTCVSVCALTPTDWYECAALMLVGSNTKNQTQSVLVNASTNSHVLSHTTVEIGPSVFSTNINTAPDSDEFKKTVFEFTRVKYDYCGLIWDGSLLSSGEEPKGKLWLQYPHDRVYEPEVVARRGEDGLGDRWKEVLTGPLRWFGTWWSR